MAFYNKEMLTKRGSLAGVWMAAHLSSKLSKTALLAIDVTSSVLQITSTSSNSSKKEPMALRLSGQLLLGFSRIYSRKTKYLLDDCLEVLGRVKKAFTSAKEGGGSGGGGQVDLDAGGEGNRDAITLRAEQGGVLEDVLGGGEGNFWDLNFNLPDANAKAGPSKVADNPNKKANTSNKADITLQEDHLYYDQDLGDQDFDFGPEGPIESQFIAKEEEEGYQLDLGLDDLEDEVLPVGDKGKGKRKRDDDEESVEAGRRGSTTRGSSLGPLGGEGDLSMDKDMIGSDQIDLGGEDMAYFPVGDDPFRDMGGGEDFFAANNNDRTPQASVNGDLDPEIETTPKLNEGQDETTPTKAVPKKEKKEKKQVIDRVTELELEGGKENAEKLEARKALLFTAPQFLPRSRTALHLTLLSEDPSYHLPKPLDTIGNLFSLAQPGLAPELAELYTFPSRRALIRAAGRAREATADVEVEKARKRAAAASESGAEELEGFLGDDPFANAGEGNGDWGHDDGYEPDNVGRGDDTFQFEDMEMIDGLGEGGEENVKAGSQSQRKRQKLRAEPDEEEDEAKLIESKGPLAVFDDTTSTTQTQQQTQTLSQSLGEDDEELVADGGLLPGKWSKNTFKAVGVLRKELGGDKEEAEGKKVVFAELAEGASRRAVASMFFELLVLSTRDCIKIEQKNPYDKITVQAKEKLWVGV